MGITITTTVLNVADLELAVAWYSDLLGGEPDRRPMAPSAEWDLTDSSAVMVDDDADAAGGSTLIIGVDDIDGHTAELYRRAIVLEPYTVSSGQFRLAELTTRPATPSRSPRPCDGHRSRSTRTVMAKLSAKKRAALKPSQFGLPEKAQTEKARKETGNYPMPDEGHAISAVRLAK